MPARLASFFQMNSSGRTRRYALFSPWTQSDLLEELSPLPLLSDPDLALHREAELAVAVKRPEGVDGEEEILHGELARLSVKYTQPRSSASSPAGDAHQAAVFVVGLLPLARLERVAKRGCSRRQPAK